jgi:hypothetical protein
MNRNVTRAAVQPNDQLVVPVAACQVAPLSVDTSTAVTIPPPPSEAVPVIVMAVPAGTDVPDDGDVIADVGATVSDDADAATSPDCSVPG